MILLEREDVDRIGLEPYPFLTFWNPDDPEQWAVGNAQNFPDLPAPGPFLLVVDDEYAWAGQRKDGLHQVAGKRLDSQNRRWWQALAGMYSSAMGISTQSMVLRYTSMGRHLRRAGRGEWHSWNHIYHWPEGRDLAWSALVHGRHPWFEVREHQGQRQITHRARPR